MRNLADNIGFFLIVGSLLVIAMVTTGAISRLDRSVELQRRSLAVQVQNRALYCQVLANSKASDLNLAARRNCP